MMDRVFALRLLQNMLGPNARFRPSQWEAIEAVALQKKRILVVQRTGWGKSMVYFLATRILRQEGSGPTLLISPLLSLMRNQLSVAAKIRLHAKTINSDNYRDWQDIYKSLERNEVDLLIISPERLNNRRFQTAILPLFLQNAGMLVVDEAHCISDWGHDFRPDYRRIIHILEQLPPNTPVLGTTATANDRVIEDIQQQLGQNLEIFRGPLDRPSLRLQAIRLENPAQRLAWLAENLPILIKNGKSGIIYCQTRNDVELVTNWLKEQGFNAEAYHADIIKQGQREQLENEFLANKIQILVATIALGMGFDKPDIYFVIHYQAPGSVIAYYQQVGRAGRAINRSYGILLAGAEDLKIQTNFIAKAFVDESLSLQILEQLKAKGKLTKTELLDSVNISEKDLENALTELEADGAIFIKGVSIKYTGKPWMRDHARIQRRQEQQFKESTEIQNYIDHKGCLMEYLLKALNDPNAKPCGRCANCVKSGMPAEVSFSMLDRAEVFWRNLRYPIKARTEFPAGVFGDKAQAIPTYLQNQPGWSLCRYGDAGWGEMVHKGKYINQPACFDYELVNASAELIQDRWKSDPMPKWICCIPSSRNSMLVPQFAKELARRLGIPFRAVLRRTMIVEPQKTMQNEAMQARNVIDSMEVVGKLPKGPVLLIDDIIDSGWTLTWAGYLLRDKGSGPVYPFTIARASTRKNK